MFAIITDSCADLRPDYVAVQSDFVVVPMQYTIGAETYVDAPGQGLEAAEFYRRLSAGDRSSTAQINPDTLIEVYRPLLAQGKDVLSILLSSGLSGTYQSSVIAKEALDAENLPGKLYLVDSLAASAGEGLMVHLALQKRA
ncbi:MAG: DegV family EDD domain-containing protein, partial [Clostridia bacterium]|nr:DegV family EDD domain-containing protein [Clostridia bacterium]